ncbi:UNVERIFIED_ORG: hypothetical protein M2438_000073 [Methylobacterium sp. SuP10 SLI 274]|nr:hypothetical protein [Methylobacterium sp. SuP10 SLI 274]
MVAIGPTPGNTPISVPTRQPRKQSSRFCRLSATPKPRPRLERRSGTGLRSPSTGHRVPGDIGPAPPRRPAQQEQQTQSHQGERPGRQSQEHP